jgi:hypothetical protein
MLLAGIQWRSMLNKRHQTSRFHYLNHQFSFVAINTSQKKCSVADESLWSLQIMSFSQGQDADKLKLS